MALIKVLPEQLRNQIAAGEVVERPSSVVKELVENSIDAGAARIVLEIEEGGVDLIRVTDDGLGMDREDARLALERHATSKIASESDLHCIGTMGFRGEALASIASVSQFTLKTKKRGEVEGTQVVCNGGLIEKDETVGCPEGTQIEVKNLFYNTPARKKYLKTKGTEYLQILGIMTNLALAHPEVSFAFVKEGKTTFDIPGTKDLKDRVRALLGKAVSDELIPVFYGGGDIQVAGFIGKPSVARSSRRAQYLFVNQRAIQHSSLSYMVRDAYGTLLMDGKQPLFVLMVSIDPKLVDVNVHPRKTEVRFVDQREVTWIVRRACKAALESHVVAPKVERGEVVSREERKLEFGQAVVPLRRDRSFVERPEAEGVQGAMEFGRDFSVGMKRSLTEFGQQEEDVSVDEMLSTETAGMEREAGGLEKAPLSMKPLAQVANSYVVAQNADGLVLIDQHAAHERVLFEKFKTAWGEKSLNKQPLLMPLHIELSHQEIAVFEENSEVFEKLGFEIEAFGGNTFSVGAVPSDMARSNVEKLLMGILDDLVNERKLKSAEERKIKILEYMACRTAIKFGDALTMEEMEALVREMDKTEGIATCPHGRPTMIPLTFYDLEKQFGRKG